MNIYTCVRWCAGRLRTCIYINIFVPIYTCEHIFLSVKHACIHKYVQVRVQYKFVCSSALIDCALARIYIDTIFMYIHTYVQKYVYSYSYSYIYENMYEYTYRCEVAPWLLANFRIDICVHIYTCL